MTGSVNLASINYDKFGLELIRRLFTEQGSTLIPEESDLNSYTTPGKFVFKKGSINTLINLPSIDNLEYFYLNVISYGIIDDKIHMVQELLADNGKLATREVTVVDDTATFNNWKICIDDEEFANLINSMDGKYNSLTNTVSSNYSTLTNLINNLSNTVSSNYNSLSNRITELANNVSSVHVSNTAPSNKKCLWIDTGNGNVAKFYNGSAWVCVTSTWS